MQGAPRHPFRPADPSGGVTRCSQLKPPASRRSSPRLHAWSCLLIVCLLESPTGSQLGSQLLAEARPAVVLCLAGCRPLSLRWRKQVGPDRALWSPTHPSALALNAQRRKPQTKRGSELLAAPRPLASAAGLSVPSVAGTARSTPSSSAASAAFGWPVAVLLLHGHVHAGSSRSGDSGSGAQGVLQGESLCRASSHTCPCDGWRPPAPGGSARGQTHPVSTR